MVQALEVIVDREVILRMKNKDGRAEGAWVLNIYGNASLCVFTCERLLNFCFFLKTLAISPSFISSGNFIGGEPFFGLI